MSPGTGAFAARSNLNATTAPTVTDARDKGYGIGSRWMDMTTGRKYTCQDPTVGAAVWIEDAADVTDAAHVADAGAVMDSDFSGADGFMRKVSSGTYEVIKSNMAASAAPTVNEDSGDGYGIGSRWFDIVNDKEYVCLDATAGAAVWIETTGTAGAGLWESASSITKLTTAEDINIQQKELLAAAIETLTAAERGALSPVTAQLCYDTDDSHLWINV